MSFQYQCSVGNYLREEVQQARETISEMQKTIDDLVFQRDDAMDKADYYEREYYFLLKYYQENKLNKNATD